MQSSDQVRRVFLLLITVSVAVLLPYAASAQAQTATQSPSAALPTAPLPPADAAAPSPAVAAVITDAQAKVKAGQFAEALAVLTEAVTPSLPAADKKALDFALADAQQAWGSDLINKRNYAEAITHLTAAVAEDDRDVQRRGQEALGLRRIGYSYNGLGQYEKAIQYYEQALPIYRKVKDRRGEAGTLGNLGIAYAYLSQYAKVIGYVEQTLPIYRMLKDRDDEAGALSNLGGAYLCLSQYEKAIVYFEQALPIYRTVNDRFGESTVLGNLGAAYGSLSQYEKAITYYEQALPSYRMVKDRHGEAIALNNIGGAYGELGQHAKAIGYHEQALAIDREIKDRNEEAGTLANLGVDYNALSQSAKAIGDFNQALTIVREIKDRNGEATVLNGEGVAYEDLGQNEKAIVNYQMALAIFKQIKGRNGEAGALANLGFAYRNLSQYERAIFYFEQALLILRQVKNRNQEAEALRGLSSVWSKQNNANRNSRLAILFGKEAVKVLQSIRADIHGLDKQTQQKYAKSKESTYRTLAALLIAQHRLPEALQVLDILKQEEYLNFNKPTPGKSNADGLLARAATLAPREQRCAAALEAVGGVLEQDVAKLGDLENVKQPTAAQQHQLAAAMAKEAADESNYQKILASLASAFPKEPDPALDRLESTSNSRELQAALLKLGNGSVAIYTLATDKKIQLLLVTPNRIVSRDEALKDAAVLDKKIVAFRDVLQDYHHDPRPLGKQLYDLLIGPIRRDLDRAHAKTLLVSLDGNLRYIPLAALSPDGKHYLVETYRTALYTPAAIANLTRTPKPKWTALAMGVSETPDGFAPLKAVPAELHSIVRPEGEPAGPDAGLYPGTTLLNAKFTKPAMISALVKNYPLVHIASHFVFTGDETTSFLLLGDGSHMTLSDLKALPAGVFAGVNLLTLSACETATGGIAVKGGAVGGGDAANGSRDVENVAVLAQRKGADAVLASLWSVSDESTGLLMRTFYRDRQGVATGRSESKAEALRQAQLALLTGTAKVAVPRQVASSSPTARPPVAGAPKRSELLSTAPAAKAAIDAPAFTPDPGKPWAHPYYWAPFILIGNWK